MPRATLKSVAVLLFSIGAFYWRILFTRQFSFLISDEGVRQHYAWLRFWVNSIRHGQWPLWDPYIFAGRSFPGEMQTAAFYPLHLFLAILPFDRYGQIPPNLYHQYFALTHFLAACFMFALVRELGLSRFSGIVSGLVFSLGGFVGKVGWPHLLDSAMWLPLLFLLLLRALRSDSLRRSLSCAGLAGLVLGMSILAGGLHVVMMQTIVVVTAGLFFVYSQAGAVRRPWQTLALVAIVVGIGLAAGAIQLLPSMEYSAHSLRWVSGAVLPASEKIPYADLTDYNWPQGVTGYLFPFAFNGRVGSGENLGSYLGVFPLLLACIGVWKCWSNLWVRYAAGLALASILYSFGPFSLLHGLAYVGVPLLWMAREASRFLYLAHFGLVILVAYGAETLFAGPRELYGFLNRSFGWLAGGCAAVLVFAAANARLELGQGTAFSFLLIFLSYGLFRYVALNPAGRMIRSLAVALILFDLNAVDWNAINLNEVARTGVNHLERLRSLLGVVAFLRSQPAHAFRVQFAVDPPMNPGDAFELETVDGGAVTMVKNYREIESHGNLLNVRYFVRLAAAPHPLPQTRQVYADASWKIYEDPQTLPRAWIVHEALIEPSHEALLARLKEAGTDYGRVALFSSPLAASLEPAADPAADYARIQSYSADRLVLTARTASTGLLVLSEMFYPGWEARVNGMPAHIEEVDGGLRSVVVPAGSTAVEFSYHANSIVWGGVVTLLTFFGTLACVLYNGRTALTDLDAA